MTLYVDEYMKYMNVNPLFQNTPRLSLIPVLITKTGGQMDNPGDHFEATDWVPVTISNPNFHKV